MHRSRVLPHGRELRGIHIIHVHIHRHSVAADVTIVCHLMRHDGLSLLLLQHSLLLNGNHAWVVPECILLLLLEHLRVKVLQRVGIRSAGAWRHSPHHGWIDLTPGAGYCHVRHLMRHARLRTWLAWVMGHARSHWVARRDAWMLLHCAWVKSTRYGLHHVLRRRRLRRRRLSTAGELPSRPAELSHPLAAVI